MYIFRLLPTISVLSTLISSSFSFLNINVCLVPQLISQPPAIFFLDDQHKRKINPLKVSTKDDEDQTAKKKGKGDNKAMAFLRKKGKVGGTSAQDFINALGVDEGPSGKSGGGMGTTIRKAKTAYTSCVESGCIDDMSENFPFTSSGTEWCGVTDRVMGGVSKGTLTREQNVGGRVANVLRGKVSLQNNGGFVQMATDLALDPSVSQTVDASEFDGVEFDLYYDGDNDVESFNVHIRNPACLRQFSSYRATFTMERKCQWETIRLSWSDFVGHGPGSDVTPFDVKALRRLGLLAIGKEMDVYLALGGIRFYNVF